VTRRTAAVLLAVLLVAPGCTAKKASPSPGGGGGFNAANLPPIHTDACPAAGELLAQPVDGGKDHLPDLQLECIGEIGSTVRVPLRRIGGMPTVINLWGSWCVPCRQEMPDLQRAYGDMRGKVRLLGINTDDNPEAARATINSTQVTWPSLADPDAKVREQIGPQFMPATLFIAADGRIVHRKYGRLAPQQFRALVLEHLGVRL
jgi:cytochrome c biogenesis protein CcmG/thiol:disulfide interchange protein DsbE